MTASARESARLFDPFDPAVLADPYPAYARLRDHDPVSYLPEYDVWMVTRYDDVVAIARDPARFSSKIGMSPDFAVAGGPQTGVSYRIGAPSVRVLIATDPPEHQIFRRAVAGAFTPASVTAATPRIRALARERVRVLRERSEAGCGDFFTDLAEPLPVLVLADLLGVPADMHEEFRDWSTVITKDLDQASGPPRVGRGIEMFRYFSRQLRRATPGRANLFDAIATARSAGVSEQELLAFCAFLLVAGIETTTNLLTNLMAALLRFPGLQDRIRDDPGLVPTAVDEAIRYDTPVQALWRGTREPVELHGRTLPADARVLLVWGAANRDGRRFDQPDEFRPDRRPNDHVGFGAGPHFCLGARLATAEVAAVLHELFAAAIRVEPAGEPVLTRSLVLRGRTSLPVRLVSR
ncbi:cytochrome P450 [Micromonospora aurantiaca]|uniref:cytochrome P450 n=1 Tax=Micromonospora aurantiaca (nom. illeg.) TaxID=47850 RepID=UPI0033B0543F